MLFMQTIFIILALLSIPLTIVFLINPPKLFFCARPENRTRLRVIKCGASTVIMFFFLFGLFQPNNPIYMLIITLLIVAFCSRVIYNNTLKIHPSVLVVDKQIIEDTPVPSVKAPINITPPIQQIEEAPIPMPTQISIENTPVEYSISDELSTPNISHKSSFLEKIKTAYQNWTTTKNGKKQYALFFKDALADDTLFDTEKEKLLEIAKQYNLSDKDLAFIHKKICKYYIDKIQADKRVSDFELETLKDILQWTHQENYKFSEKAALNIDHYHLLWKVEIEGLLPTVDWSLINIIPKKDEILHWTEYGGMLKIKNVTRRINYGGPTASIRICKGVSYRTGSVGVSKSTEEVVETIDSGDFWITNQRVGFIGDKKNFTIPFNKILSFNVSSSYGLMIYKEGAMNPQMIKLDNYDLPCIILSKILNA